MEIKEKVRAYIERLYRKRKIEDEENIFELGFVNSLFAMQLILFLEKEFSITIGNEDMDITNFSSINRIVGLIESKTNSLKSEKSMK
ncbi:D-alanine--poly(phosphoribitol) ligase subunit 2 [compost metagenome]